MSYIQFYKLFVHTVTTNVALNNLVQYSLILQGSMNQPL